MGFVMNGGQPMDPYAQGMDPYGQAVDEYGQPVDEYGRPMMLDEYDHYPQGYGGYPPDGMTEEEYMYSSGMR